MLDPQLAFQHTAARRRLRDTGCACSDRSSVSTHSRTKAAARFPTRKKYRITVSTHSRPKVAAKHGITSQIKTHVSTHSHPKAAAKFYEFFEGIYKVSTHSRTKAAAPINLKCLPVRKCFNTQPHEGGCAPMFLLQ